MPFDEREQEHVAFLYALSAECRRRTPGVPYEELVDALGLGRTRHETARREIQEEGLVELDLRPADDRVGRTVLDSARRAARWSDHRA